MNLGPRDYEFPISVWGEGVCSGLINPYLRMGNKIHPGYERYRAGKIGLSMEEIVRQAAKLDKASS